MAFDFDKNIEQIVEAVKTGNPVGVCDLLAERCKYLSKESLKGFTPDAHLSEYWRSVASRFREASYNIAMED